MTKQQFQNLSEKYLNGSANADEEKLLFAWYEVLQKKQVNTSSLTVEQENQLFNQLLPVLDHKSNILPAENRHAANSANPAVKLYFFTGYFIGHSLKRIVHAFQFTNGFAYRKEAGRK